MKNIQGYLIIGISIIIGALIIGFFIFKTNNANNHCYNKVYNELKKTSGERFAAARAIRKCGLHPNGR
jgi:hypothetical protein